VSLKSCCRPSLCCGDQPLRVGRDAGLREAATGVSCWHESDDARSGSGRTSIAAEPVVWRGCLEATSSDRAIRFREGWHAANLGLPRSGDPDGVLEISDGVTRATRIAKLAPGESVPVTVIGHYRRCRADSRAALGEDCADLHGRGLWDAENAELLEAVWRFRQGVEAATVAPELMSEHSDARETSSASALKPKSTPRSP
jgi:hypothetical protein